jgi:hypothetical protein
MNKFPLFYIAWLLLMASSALSQDVRLAVGMHMDSSIILAPRN